VTGIQQVVNTYEDFWENLIHSLVFRDVPGKFQVHVDREG